MTGMNVHVFTSNAPDLQAHIQNWLKANPDITITNVAQSTADTGEIVVTLFYTTVAPDRQPSEPAPDPRLDAGT